MEYGIFELDFNLIKNNITEFLVNSDKKTDAPQLTRPILTKYELAGLLNNYANLLNENIDSEFNGVKLQYENPILNACDLIIKRIIPFNIKRNILFDNKTFEVFNISEMYINDRDVYDIKRYIIDNYIPLTDIEPEKIFKLINDTNLESSSS